MEHQRVADQTLSEHAHLLCVLSDDVDWDKLDTACKVDFIIDGEVIFTREVPYGNLLTDQPGFNYQMNDGRTVVGLLYQSEQDAVCEAGYRNVSWAIPRKDPLFVIEDRSFEAIHNDHEPAKRTCSVTIVDE